MIPRYILTMRYCFSCTSRNRWDGYFLITTTRQKDHPPGKTYNIFIIYYILIAASTLAIITRSSNIVLLAVH